MLALISTSSFLRCHSSFAFTAVTAAVFSLMLSSFVPTSSSFYFIFIIIFFLSIFCCSYKHYCRRNLSLWHFSSFSSFIINFLDVCEWFFSSRCHISLSFGGVFALPSWLRWCAYSLIAIAISIYDFSWCFSLFGFGRMRRFPSSNQNRNSTYTIFPTMMVLLLCCCCTIV